MVFEYENMMLMAIRMNEWMKTFFLCFVINNKMREMFSLDFIAEKAHNI